MDMPTRIEIRQWLEDKTRAEILELLAAIRTEHGQENEQDVRDFLNHEREIKKPNTPAEKSLSDQFAANEADFQSQKRLYGDA